MRGASKHIPHNRHPVAVAAAAAPVQTQGRDGGGSTIRWMALWEARSAPKRHCHCRSSPSDSDNLANHRTVLNWPTAPFVLSFLEKEAPCESHVFRLWREGIENVTNFHLRVSSRSRLAPATCLIAIALGGYMRGCHHSASRSVTEPPLNQHSPYPRRFGRW